MLVRRLLEVPADLAGVGIERDGAGGVEIVARAELRIEARIGIAGAEIEKKSSPLCDARSPPKGEAVESGCLIN